MRQNKGKSGGEKGWRLYKWSVRIAGAKKYRYMGKTVPEDNGIYVESDSRKVCWSGSKSGLWDHRPGII